MEYDIPDSELRPWERCVRRFIERRPRLGARIDRFMESDDAPAWIWSVILFATWVMGTMLTAAVALGLWFVFGSPWNLVAVAFAAAAAIMAVATVVIHREDRRR